MTDQHPALTDDDLSAYLDDEVTPELRARVEADAEATDRLHHLSVARDALRDAPVTPLPVDVVDDLVSRALRATGGDAPAATDGDVDGATDAGDGTAPDDTGPVPLPPARRPARRGSGAWPGQWPVAAAVFVLVAVGIGFVWSGLRDQGDESFDAIGTEVSDQDAAPAEGGARDDGAGVAGEASTEGADVDTPGDGAHPPIARPEELEAVSTAPADLPHLGSFDTAADLRRALRDGFPGEDRSAVNGTDEDPLTEGQVDRCAGVLQVQVAPGSERLHAGEATVDGTRYVVYEFGLPDGSDLGGAMVAVVDPVACSPLITFVR